MALDFRSSRTGHSSDFRDRNSFVIKLETTRTVELYHYCSYTYLPSTLCILSRKTNIAH